MRSNIAGDGVILAVLADVPGHLKVYLHRILPRDSSASLAPPPKRMGTACLPGEKLSLPIVNDVCVPENCCERVDIGKVRKVDEDGDGGVRTGQSRRGYKNVVELPGPARLTRPCTISFTTELPQSQSRARLFSSLTPVFVRRSRHSPQPQRSLTDTSFWGARFGS